MELKAKLRKELLEGNYVVKKDDLNDIQPEIEKEDPDAIIKVVDEQEVDEPYNAYAVCTDSIAKTAGTSERSEWSDVETERYEKCVKKLKGKKGYKLGESVKPKMTKNELVETILNKNCNVVKKIKIKDIKK